MLVEHLERSKRVRDRQKDNLSGQITEAHDNPRAPFCFKQLILPGTLKKRKQKETKI
jgi:hypothetical protein